MRLSKLTWPEGSAGQRLLIDKEVVISKVSLHGENGQDVQFETG